MFNFHFEYFSTGKEEFQEYLEKGFEFDVIPVKTFRLDPIYAGYSMSFWYGIQSLQTDFDH